MTKSPDDPVVLLTGATGYIGGRLLPRLEEQVRVRCLVRRPTQLAGKTAASTEVVPGDVMDVESLRSTLEGVETAYYLIHSMGESESFANRDRQAARNFAEAAQQARVRKIIYLGGLGDSEDPKLSPHLKSRQEVGAILRQSGVETIEFRASVVVGAGSLSFELIKSLTERLPVMICPRWLSTPTQPIAVDDVLEYLVAARTMPIGESRIYEIGGTDVITYGELIREYAKQRGLHRLLIYVPVLSPYLSSLWLGLVTPATAEVGRHLIEGLKNSTIVRDQSALHDFPIRPMGIRDAVAQALAESSRSS